MSLGKLTLTIHAYWTQYGVIVAAYLTIWVMDACLLLEYSSILMFIVLQGRLPEVLIVHLLEHSSLFGM